MNEEYDIEKSTKKVGQLIPRILAADGSVLDGNHRGEEWRSETLPWIDTEEKKLLARAIANWHRRPVSREEKEVWINGLAKIYQEQGCQVRGAGRVGTPPNEIADKIMLETGLSRSTVMSHLSDDFKQTERQSEKGEKYVISASQRIETKLGADYVDRHREEVIEEEKERIREAVINEVKKDPEVRAEIVKEEREKTISEIQKEYPSDKPKTYGPRYYRNVVNTFYRIRGWGVPMVLSMGKTTWDKTLPYVQGIHDWSGFLLSIRPEASMDKIPDPPSLQVSVDNRKIVEADYQIVEGK